MKIFLFFFFKISLFYCEIIKIKNLQVWYKSKQLPLNTITNINRFVFLNNTLSNSQISGLNFSLTLNITFKNLTNRFHIYLLKSDAIPHFDFINNPAVNIKIKNRSAAHQMVLLYVMTIQTVLIILLSSIIG